MTVRPIIFSGPMVRAIIALRKTQTRRLASSPLRRCQPGDRLYVRETFAELGEGYLTITKADYPQCVPAHFENVPAADEVQWRPSIHMPRRVSRITLTIEAVRVEPLQVISEADCVAEGINRLSGGGPNHFSVDLPNGWAFSQPTAPPVYAELWKALHGEESWDANPDVLVLAFKPLAGNVDRIAA